MSLPELATPIRIYWDLTPLPAEPPDHGKIAAALAALKILNLDLIATGQSIPPVCCSVIKTCLAGRMGVTLTVSPGALDGTAAEALALNPPKEILYELNSFAELQSLTPFPAAITGISFPLGDKNWGQIADVIRFCAEHGIKRLVFPMQRLYRGETPFHVPAHGLTAIAASLASFTAPPDLRITAHDPFVWRSIFPHTPFPNGRCQAANTMLSIDQNGVVYPCPVMPIALGDLKTTSLQEIARGVAKKELRNFLLQSPGECSDCPDVAACTGGCRGRSERLFGTWNRLDPGCR